jgi:hypothetical protein
LLKVTDQESLRFRNPSPHFSRSVLGEQLLYKA